MTVDANGDVTTVVSFKNDSEPTRTATYTARAVKATGNIYYWDAEGLDGADALLPGITGLGVADFRLEPGFILEEGHYTPVSYTHLDVYKRQRYKSNPGLHSRSQGGHLLEI